MVRYSVGNKVTYGLHGLCEITEIREMDFSGKSESYYILTPISETRSTVFVPCENELLVSKIRSVMTADEITSLTRIIPDFPYIENASDRKRKFTSALASGDRSEIVTLIKVIDEEKSRRLDIGKKISASDEVFLSEASKLLYEEFSYVLGLTREQVIPFILGELN